jgi:hypothetical protein
MCRAWCAAVVGSEHALPRHVYYISQLIEQPGHTHTRLQMDSNATLLVIIQRAKHTATEMRSALAEGAHHSADASGGGWGVWKQCLPGHAVSPCTGMAHHGMA